MQNKKNLAKKSLGARLLFITPLIALAFFILIWLMPIPYYTTGFRNLHELQYYATTLDEWIQMENDNVLFPNYDNYYKTKFSMTFWNQWKEKLDGFLVKFFFKPKPIFSPSFFKELLLKTTEYRLEKGWTKPLVQKTNLNKNSKIITFGVVQGAYHSLVRYLTKLYELQIIDENLKLKDQNYYIVFMGNVVNRSPWTLEIFSIVLRLLEKNPENVIYLRGLNEFHGFWEQHTLIKELKFRCRNLTTDEIPLEKEVDTFFETLPLSIYFTIPYAKENSLPFIKIQPLIKNQSLATLVNESYFASFIAETNKKGLTSFILGPQKSESQNVIDKIQAKAIIMDIYKRESYITTDGLRLLEPTKGIITWNLHSSPAEPYRKGLKFFNDAFTIIEPEDVLDKTKITLYYRDIRNKELQFKTRTHYFFTGKPISA